ncbi:relaxase/mobilization nuclease domain-containing protein [Puniceicoccaceae bacterium K14]|nr:relaxase/mobilization nuclease domain-containing protein [Puniceicoccaceae bacterium K14]
MNPNLAEHGTSFKGAFMYYMHDKNADTRERIAWAETRNTITANPDKAWKVMAYTAKHQNRLKEAEGRSKAGRKDTKPVMAYSLSWHPNHDPSKEHMTEVAMQSMKVLGVEDHEAIIVAHRDTPHRHVHVIVNRIHPKTGMIADDSYTWRRLSDFAREYQREHNMNYCPQREENYRKRQQGKNTKYRDPHIQNAWSNSDNGKSFIAALESDGYRLAQGRKRLVVVDPYGKTHNPVRHIEGIKTKEFNDRLSDIDRSALPEADILTRETQALHEEKKRKQTSSKSELKNGFSNVALEPNQTIMASFNDHGKASTNHMKKEFNEQSEESSKNKHTVIQKPLPDRKAANDNSKEQAKLEKQIADSLRNLQDRHLGEQADLSEFYRKRIMHEEDTLSKFHNIAERRREITTLNHKVENAPWWRKILRLNHKDKQQLSDLRSGLVDALDRKDERIEAIQIEYSDAKKLLKQKYEKLSSDVIENQHLFERHSAKQSFQKSIATGLEKDKIIKEVRKRREEHSKKPSSRGRGRGAPRMDKP